MVQLSEYYLFEGYLVHSDRARPRRVNPVETLFAAFPAYLYLNASLGGALLAPLLDSQAGLSGQPYAAQDVGLNYPNATGARWDSQQSIEREQCPRDSKPQADRELESGNTLIMMYAHARVSGDGTLLSRHVRAHRGTVGCSAILTFMQYDTAKRWADHLVNNTLTPYNQYVPVPPLHYDLQAWVAHRTLVLGFQPTAWQTLI